MRPASLIAGLLLVTATAWGLAAQPGHSPRTADCNAQASERWRRQEAARVQAHLLGAERELRGASTAHLSLAQRAARERNIALLHGYRERATFPRNIHHTQHRTPYFVDDRGVLCAMAYLIACSGRNDIVARVRATQNNARIKDLASDAELVEWLGQSGLTLAEAARIQPYYDYGPVPEQAPLTSEYLRTSVVATLANAGAIASNLMESGPAGPPRWRGALAMAVGGLSIGLGAANLDATGAAQGVGIWNVAVGAVSFGMGTYTLLGKRDNRGPNQAVDRVNSPRGASLSVAPVFVPNPGLQLALSF